MEKNHVEELRAELNQLLKKQTEVLESRTVENPGLRYWDAGYGVQQFHPIAETSQFSDHLARAVLP